VVAVTRAVLLVIVAAVASACFALGGPVKDRESFWLLFTNDTDHVIIVKPAAPIGDTGAWKVLPGDLGPHAYARAGTTIDVLAEDCSLIGQILLPTRFNSGEPMYTVRADGVIEEHDNPLAHLGDVPPLAAPGQDLCP
jgi:hypothetical protein